MPTTSHEIKLALGNTDSVLSNDETKNRINHANNLYNSIYISQYTELKRSEEVGGTCVGSWERHVEVGMTWVRSWVEHGQIVGQDVCEDVGKMWVGAGCG